MKFRYTSFSKEPAIELGAMPPKTELVLQYILGPVNMEVGEPR